MAIDRTLVGQKGGRARITIERSATERFARAVKSTNPSYTDPAAAAEAGIEDGQPVPPTFLVAAAYWGSFAEQQPADPGPDPVSRVLRGFLSQGALVLHGEQSYDYHRPLRVGDVLDVETELVDLYEKSSMTFAVGETRYTDAATGELVATARASYINRG